MRHMVQRSSTNILSPLSVVARVLVNESDELAIKLSNNFDAFVLVPLQE